jgi:NTP pyrophosphatase (non-canonical NTP hydrolase)
MACDSYAGEGVAAYPVRVDYPNDDACRYWEGSDEQPHIGSVEELIAERDEALSAEKNAIERLRQVESRLKNERDNMKQNMASRDHWRSLYEELKKSSYYTSFEYPLIQAGCGRIWEHYGSKVQARKIVEESYELAESISEYRLGETTGTGHIAEELADVLVLIGQVADAYSIDRETLEKLGREKIDRQLKRMDDD